MTLRVQLDLLARLQVLSGTLGREMNLRRPAEALAGIQQEEGHRLHPLWFDTGNTGMADAMRKSMSRVLTDEQQVEDLLTDFLMGFRRNLTGMGEKARDAILGGQSPKGNITTTLGRWAYRTALSVQETQNRRAGIQHENPVEDFIDIEAPEPTHPSKLLVELFMDQSDPLGEEIRSLFRRTLQGMTQQRAAQMFLDNVGRVPKLKRTEIARRLKMSPQLVTGHVNLGLAACHKALAKDHNLLNKLAEYLGQSVDTSATKALFANLGYVGEARYNRL